MQTLTIEEAAGAGGGMTAIEGAGLILAFTACALGSPVVVGVGFGAAAGLLIADYLAK